MQKGHRRNYNSNCASAICKLAYASEHEKAGYKHVYDALLTRALDGAGLLVIALMQSFTFDARIALNFMHFSNDNAPTFAHSQYDFVVERNAPVGSWIGRVCARDADASDAGLVRQRLVTTGDLSELAFRLDDDSGDLWLVASVEQVPVGSRFRLELSAEDGDARVSERNAAVNVRNGLMAIWNAKKCQISDF